MRNRFKKGFKRVLSGTMALITAFSVASGFMMPVSAEGTDKVLTGTDLDNFDVSLNWGDKSEGLSDDYQLNAFDKNSKNDKEYQVKMQVTVQYSGNETKSYQPGELSIKLSDFYDIYQNSGSSSLFTVDVGAELEGSGSGRGDWYYTKTFNTATKKFDYVLTNKNIVNTAFTSTVQFVFTLKSVRNIKQYSLPKSIQAEFSDGINSFTSNELNFTYYGKQDTHSLSIAERFNILSSCEQDILKLIPEDEWSNYYYGYITFNTASERYSIGVSQVNMKTNLPDDVIYITGNDWKKSDPPNFSYSPVNTVNYSISQLKIVVAFPKEKYKDTENIELTGELYGTYLDSNDEELLAKDSQIVDFSKIKDDDYLGRLGNISDIFYANSTENLYKDTLQQENPIIFESYANIHESYNSNYVKNRRYNTVVSSNLSDTTYRYDDSQAYRRLDKSEINFKSINFNVNKESLLGFEYEIFGKQYNTDTSESIMKGVANKSNIIELSEYTEKQFEKITVKFYNLQEESDINIYFSYYLNAKIDLDMGNNIRYFIQPYKGYIELYNEDGNVDRIKPDTGSTSHDNVPNEEWKRLLSESESYEAVFAPAFLLNEIKYSTTAPVKKGSLSSTDSVKNDRIYVSYPSDRSTSLKWSINNPSKSKSLLKQGFDVEIEYDSYQKLEASVQGLEAPGFTITYGEEIALGNGKKKCTIHYEIDNEITFTDSLKYTALGFYLSVSMDDYYLLNLSSKKSGFKYTIKNLEVYNEITQMNYPIEYSASENYTYPLVASNTYQGIETEVSTDARPEYTKLKTKVNLDGEYSYKLKASAGETQMAKIVMYDNLEQQEGSAWWGTFNGVSFEKLEQAGIDTSKFKTYYSTDRNQECSLDAEGWVLSADYKGKLEDVKSIAVDLDGYVLNTKQRMYIEVMMKSPAEGTLGSTTLNQYNASYQEFDESDVNLTTPLKTTTNLASNITEVALGDVLTKLTISKSWIDDNDSLKVRPDSISGKIYQNGIEIRSFTLDKEHKWSAVVDDLRMYDDSGTAYEYTISEDPVSDYVSDISTVKEENGNFSFIIKNTISDDLAVKVSGTKIWDDDNNSYGTRPAEISIDLYQNGTKIASTDTDADKEWKYSFDYQPKFDSEGNEYVYTVQEHNYERYNAEYIPSKTGVRVHFSELSRTEAVSYDYMEIYYILDGKTYSMGRYGGTSIANLTVDIPTNDFYILWRSDSSGNSYYGFAIDSVVPAQVEIPENQTEAVMQTVSGGYTECNGKNYPETSHNPYENNARQGWHYTAEQKNSIDIVNHLIRYQYLTITKLIPVDDEYQYNQEEGYGFYSRYFPEHGNPTFIFKIENDKGQAFYKTLFDDGSFDDDRMEITEINDVEYIKMSTKIEVEAGNYTISELKTSRYKLSGIKTSENGTVSDDTAILDLTKSDGSAVFINSKSNWKNFSHNDLKLNKVGAKPM